MNHIISRPLSLQLLAAFLLLLLITSCGPSRPTETPLPEATLTEFPTFELPANTLINWWDGSTFVYVPAGTFDMGEPGVTEGDNIPVHPVRMDALWIQQTEVTNRMYAQCVAAGACQPPTPDPNYPNHYPNGEYANHPVASVTWQDAVNYCTWIGGGLPSEAEWEWAALGDTGYPYPWGEQEPNCSRLNFLGCTPLGITAPVGSYPLGLSSSNLSDLAGNVFEWVHDWYGEDYYAV